MFFLLQAGSGQLPHLGRAPMPCLGRGSKSARPLGENFCGKTKAVTETMGLLSASKGYAFELIGLL